VRGYVSIDARDEDNLVPVVRGRRHGHGRRGSRTASTSTQGPEVDVTEALGGLQDGRVSGLLAPGDRRGLYARRNNRRGSAVEVWAGVMEIVGYWVPLGLGTIPKMGRNSTLWFGA
jgi:hypothetical protein